MMKKMFSVKNKIKGISLIEILIVVAIFAVLGIITTRSVILSLQGSKKSEGLVSSRENLDYAMSIIERQVRGSSEIACANSSQLNYLDQDRNFALFGCFESGEDKFVASGSASLGDRITSDAIQITNCVFTCEDDGDVNTAPRYVDIFLEAQPTGLTGPQSSRVTTQSRIYLRNY